MVKKQPPLYQKMLSFTYCKQPLLYHRKFSLTQLSSRSYIIGSSPPPNVGSRSYAKGFSVQDMMRLHLYQRTLSLPVMSGRSYLDTQQWGQPPLYQCSFSKGSHKRFYHSKRGNGKAVFTFSKEYMTGGAEKTCDTTVMGHGVASGLEFGNHTCTCVTHDHVTMVLPIPVSHPSGRSH